MSQQMTTSQPVPSNHVDIGASTALPAGSFAPTHSYYMSSENVPSYASASSVPSWNYRPQFEQNSVTPAWQQFPPMPSAMMMYSQGIYPCFDAGSSGMGADASYYLPPAAAQQVAPIAPQATSNLAPYRAFYPDNPSMPAQYFPYDSIPSQYSHPMRDQRVYSNLAFPAPRATQDFGDPRVGEKRRSMDPLEMPGKSINKRCRLDGPEPSEFHADLVARTLPPELLASYGYSGHTAPQASPLMPYPMQHPMQRGTSADGHSGLPLPSNHVLDSLVRTSSRYRGVSLARSGHWRVQVGFMKKRLNVGHFPSNEEVNAARAYDCVVRILHGSAGVFNFPTERITLSMLPAQFAHGAKGALQTAVKWGWVPPREVAAALSTNESSTPSSKPAVDRRFAPVTASKTRSVDQDVADVLLLLDSKRSTSSSESSSDTDESTLEESSAMRSTGRSTGASEEA